MFRSLFLSFLLLSGIYSFTTAQCFLKEVPSYGAPLKTTGSPKLDQVLNEELQLLSYEFDVAVNLYAYDDANSPNALAIGPYSTIILGKTLMLDELVNTNGLLSIKAIMAHEFAHIIQHKFQLNANGTWVGKWPELHADFLAGWYIGKKRYLTEDEVKQVVSSFWDKGDENYFSPDHHGTPQERALSFLQGFNSSSLSLYDAYVYGANFIANINTALKKIETNNSHNPKAYSGLRFDVLQTNFPFGPNIDQSLFLFEDQSGNFTFQNCLYHSGNTSPYSYSTGYTTNHVTMDIYEPNTGVPGKALVFNWHFYNSYDYNYGICPVRIDFYNTIVNGVNFVMSITTDNGILFYKGIWE